MRSAGMTVCTVVFTIVFVRIFFGVFRVTRFCFFGFATVVLFRFFVAALFSSLRKNHLLWQNENSQTENNQKYFNRSEHDSAKLVN
jgi:hypothetical protein